ncbi:hypothetical protein MVES_002480 [Malassezia vespertilionis]|uniref:Uncharacterized protein n=1 Tax=Malassezia vespertilionis TaxID=2020962 RepID=A0A2N1JAY7_9BASI|nr:hypothetical protein MVES_002480 [Malassezia vespertilionis]
MRQTRLSWEKSESLLQVKEGLPMPPTSRKRAAPRKSAPPPPFPQLYDGPLPTPNVFARMYLYEWLVHFDDPNALGWPLHCLDALHCWDTAIAYAFLHRLALRLSGLATLGSGQPAARTSRLIDVLRKHKHNPEAYAPWKVAESMLGDHVPPLSLSEVDMDIPVLSSRTPGVKRAATPELPVPRRTRSAARLEAAFTSISESEPELEVAQDGTRRSRRAEQLAAKKRHDDLRMQAEKMLGARTAQEEVQDEQGSMHLETKFACLARLCTLLCTTPAPKDSVPGATILHRQVQPLLDAFSDTERAAREYTAEVEETCDAEMRAFQRRGPSMISPNAAC